MKSKILLFRRLFDINKDATNNYITSPQLSFSVTLQPGDTMERPDEWTRKYKQEAYKPRVERDARVALSRKVVVSDLFVNTCE